MAFINEFSAGRDPLTGVLTLERLEEETARVLAGAERHGESAAVCILDLDGFQAVNDSLGHNAGDQLLADAAGALADRLRSTDALGRIGADEFAVVLARLDAGAARLVAADLLGAIRSCAGSMGITASAGVATSEPGDNVHTILARANGALASARLDGHDQLSVAPPAAQPVTLPPDALELHAQPIVALTDTQDTLRLELLAPDWIDDARVVGRALDILARTRDTILHVNLTAETVGDAGLMDFFETAVAAARLEAGRLVFELTETAQLTDLEAARGTFERLRALGCRLALDDFGSGLASVVYLKQLPFDFVKVGAAFVRDLGGNAADQATVKAIASIAHGLGMATVAAQVSDADALAVLRDLGVQHAQGTCLGAPKPLADYLPA